MIRNLRELYQYRALLYSLTQRELKARYRGSVLGFFWTFLNPTLQMLVYFLVFSIYLKNDIPNYPYFLFVGLLPWTFFSSAVIGGASSISDRRDLMTKVRFPAQVLPATVVSVNLFNYLFSLPLMVGLGLLFHQVPSWHVILFPFVLCVQLLFTLSVVYILSALNVGFRDLQHIIANIVQLTFFATPVLYIPHNLSDRFRAVLIYGNPMALLVTSYQRIFYSHELPEMGPLCALAVASAFLLWIASTVFERRREEFAETV